jgi:hypothetical protein
MKYGHGGVTWIFIGVHTHSTLGKMWSLGLGVRVGVEVVFGGGVTRILIGVKDEKWGSSVYGCDRSSLKGGIQRSAIGRNGFGAGNDLKLEVRTN